jgi:hypothetical protein
MTIITIHARPVLDRLPDDVLYFIVEFLDDITEITGVDKRLRRAAYVETRYRLVQIWFPRSPGRDPITGRTPPVHSRLFHDVTSLRRVHLNINRSGGLNNYISNEKCLTLFGNATSLSLSIDRKPEPGEFSWISSLPSLKNLYIFSTKNNYFDHYSQLIFRQIDDTRPNFETVTVRTLAHLEGYNLSHLTKLTICDILGLNSLDELLELLRVYPKLTLRILRLTFCIDQKPYTASKFDVEQIESLTTRITIHYVTYFSEVSQRQSIELHFIHILLLSRATACKLNLGILDLLQKYTSAVSFATEADARRFGWLSVSVSVSSYFTNKLFDRIDLTSSGRDWQESRVPVFLKAKWWNFQVFPTRIDTAISLLSESHRRTTERLSCESIVKDPDLQLLATLTSQGQFPVLRVVDQLICGSTEECSAARQIATTQQAGFHHKSHTDDPTSHEGTSCFVEFMARGTIARRKVYKQTCSNGQDFVINEFMYGCSFDEQGGRFLGILSGRYDLDSPDDFIRMPFPDKHDHMLWCPRGTFRVCF